MINEPLGAFTCRSSTLTVLADSGPFHGILLTVLGSRSDFHDYRIPGAFTCRSSTLRFWLILACFVDYYSTFWGPGVISTINVPQGAFTCRSSTFIVLAVNGPFHGLLLTVLGSQSDFHGCRTPRCAYVLVIKTRNLGRFWPFLWTITY